MAILVTGGAGYVGSHTAIALLNKGYEVVVLDNFINADTTRLDMIRKETGKNFKFYAISLEEKEILERIFKENEIEAVIHFAGIKPVEINKGNPIAYYYGNLISTLVLCEVMHERQVKKLVLGASEVIYPEQNNGNILVSGAKEMIETILQDLYRLDNSWHISLMKYDSPIGMNQEKGEMDIHTLANEHIHIIEETCHTPAIKSCTIYMEQGSLKVETTTL